MLETVHERRKQMLKFRALGIPTTEWVSLLAQKYGVTERAIWEDWHRRKSWLAKVSGMTDVADEINMSMAKLKTIEEEAWRTYDGAENAQNKLVALKIRFRAVRDEIEILQSLSEVRMGRYIIDKEANR